MKLSSLNLPSKRFAHGYTYPPHWTTKRIQRYKTFLRNNPDPQLGDDYNVWYGKLVRWMEKAGFKE